mgnify:CR=1 FL=1
MPEADPNIIETAIGWVSNWNPYLQALCGVVTSATVLTAQTPSKVDDKILNTILKVLNVVAGNVHRNANKDS